MVFNLDTYECLGAIPGTGGHGAVVDPKTQHGFSSSRPISMFDAQTMQPIKKIDVPTGPDGILFEPATERIYVFSHRAPNVTVIDPKDGSIAGTMDLGGAPEQAASDQKGRVYVDLEDENKIAVVDAKTLKMTAQYSLGGKATGPAGLGLDAKNHILFAMCREPATCVVLSADDGKILASLPIGNGTDGGGFNPNTMEAFSSQRDGTLTIIKETSPTSFEVEQTVTTKPGAKTCTLDSKNNRIILIATEAAPTPAAAAGAAPAPATPPANADQPGGGRRGGRGARGGPGFLHILVVGRQ
jgi:DNA-binding beta-propeller fold protein YncE